MANNYTQFAFVLPVEDPPAVAKAYADLAGSYDPWDDKPVPDDHPFYTEGDAFGAPLLEADDGGVHITEDESGDVECTARVVAWIMRTFPGTPDKFGFEWADICSKSRAGEFGGGAVVVTRNDDDWEWLSTGGWLHERLHDANSG